MTQSSTHKPPIFVCGVPRSGTTLLSAMLCAHSRLSCGPETHVFDGLTDEIESGICSEASWPESALDYLFSIEHGEFPIPVDYGISRDELSDYLRNADRTVTSIAAALPEIFMRKLGKVRWIDKTPNYQIHAKTVRKRFPHSPIVRILRDPRDVALSLSNVSWGPQTFLEGLLVWYKYQEESKDFFEADKLAYTICYEELVASPENELKKLCKFLGETFEMGMLNTAQSVNHVNRRNEPWKSKVADDVDKSRANAWKHVLTEEQRRQADAIIGNYTDIREQLAVTLTYLKVMGLTRAVTKRDVYILTKLLNEGKVRVWPTTVNERPVRALCLGGWRSRTLEKIEVMIKPLLAALGVKESVKRFWYR
jgi:hypothetical protein